MILNFLKPIVVLVDNQADVKAFENYKEGEAASGAQAKPQQATETKQQETKSADVKKAAPKAAPGKSNDNSFIF